MSALETHVEFMTIRLRSYNTAATTEERDRAMIMIRRSFKLAVQHGVGLEALRDAVFGQQGCGWDERVDSAFLFYLEIEDMTHTKKDIDESHLERVSNGLIAKFSDVYRRLANT